MQLRQDELLNCQITVHDLPQDLRPGTDLTSFFRSAVLASGQPLLAKDAALTFGVPWLSADANRDWFGRRFFYWKNGFPTDRLIGMAMSRVGRKLEEHKPVFDAIRTAIVGVDANREAILVSCGTAAEPLFLARQSCLDDPSCGSRPSMRTSRGTNFGQPCIAFRVGPLRNRMFLSRPY